MTRRRVPVESAVLSPRVVLTLLSGWGTAKGTDDGTDDDLFELYQARDDGIARLWIAHEAYLRAEAARLGIVPGWRHGRQRYFFGEYVIRVRASHADNDDPAA